MAHRVLRRLSLVSLACALALTGPHAVRAQSAPPRSFMASPDVYRLVAENDQYRVIEVTWKPGQRDNWHSHGTPVASYNLTDCSLRYHTPDGKAVERTSKAGQGGVRAVDPSHSVENIGTSECRVILFEPK